MMTSQIGVWMSRFWEKSFMNEYLIWKFVLLLIFIFLSTLVHEITIWTFLNFFWVDDHGEPKLWDFETNFWDSGFKNEDFISNFPLLLTFMFLSPLVQEILVCVFFHSILGEWSHRWKQNCNIFRKWSNKQIPLFNVPSNIDFDLSITLDTWYTSLGPLYLIWR